MGFEKFNQPYSADSEPEKQTPGKEKKGRGKKLIQAMAVATAIGEVFGCNPDIPEKKEVNLPAHTEVMKDSDKGLKNRMEFAIKRIVGQHEQAGITSLINYNTPGKISVDPKAFMEVRKKFWENSFKKDSKFLKGYKKMGQWKPYLEKIFKNEGINQSYIYLALIESNFIFHNPSFALADGPFQFMPETATDFKLTVNKEIDERRDPLLSGRTGARYLKELHAEAGSAEGALSAYNAGRRFLIYAKKNNIKADYANLCKYYEEKINIIKEGVGKIDHYSYTVKGKPGKKIESLEIIAANTKVDISSILKYNNLTKGSVLSAGQKIKIPLTCNAARKTLFDSKVAPIWENLNYVPRFAAALKLINEGQLEKQDAPISLKSIRCKIGLNSLAAISKKFNIPLTKLNDLNPAIINPHVKLKEGYLVRI